MSYQLASALLGIWLMAAPAVLDYGDPAASFDRTLGPSVAAVALIAVFEATRGIRWVNLLSGLVLVGLPWFAGYETGALVNSLIVGALVMALAVPRGRIKHRTGGGWRSLAR